MDLTDSDGSLATGEGCCRCGAARGADKVRVQPSDSASEDKLTPWFVRVGELEDKVSELEEKIVELSEADVETLQMEKDLLTSELEDVKGDLETLQEEM